MVIFCVDDDPDMLTYFTEAVRKLDLPELGVLFASTGKEALEIAEKRLFDLVLLDIRLPDISGIEVLRKIKSLQPLAEVLIVTGHASVETAVEAMKAGARDYIEKPMRLDLLHEKMRTSIELRERMKEVEEYRYAKETIEVGAQREIASLEDMIGCMKKCKNRVMEIIESSLSDAEKVKLVRREMSNFISKID
jgi:DNA-binding NtrC family response regulator